MREGSRGSGLGVQAKRTGSCIGLQILVIGLALGGCTQHKAETEGLSARQRTANATACEQVWRTVKDRHWDPDLGGVDWDEVYAEFKPRMQSASNMADARCLMRAMLARLDCSHFAIIPAPVGAGVSARRSLGGSSEPIAELASSGPQVDDRGETGMDIRMIDSRVVVVDVTPKSPADDAGIRPGWIVERVNSKQVEATVTAQTRRYPQTARRDRAVVRAVRRQLTGSVGETVDVQTLDGNGRRAVHELLLVEARGRRTQYGHMPPVHVWWERRMLDDGIVYLRINAFHDPKQVLPVVAATVKQHLDAPGFVLDLRGNTGGISAMAPGLAGWFVEDSQSHLGTMQLREAQLKLVVATRLTTYNGPLAVLVDEFSASTSEILAAGLRDLHRAKLFGSPTAASALPSQIMRLANGDFFQFAVGDYVSRGGERIEGAGVTPDVHVSVDRASLLAGKDTVIDAACAWIRSVPALARIDR